MIAILSALGCAPGCAAGCPAGEAPDGDTCVPVACGEGTWGSIEADVFVDAAADFGGDGSRAAPFARLQPALDAAGDAEVVALGAGSYAAVTLTGRAVGVVGRCPDLVRVVSEDGYALGVSEGETVELEGLTFAGGGVRVDRGTLVVRDTRFQDITTAALLALGGATRVELEGVSVTRAGNGAEEAEYAIAIAERAEVEVDAVTLTDIGCSGIAVVQSTLTGTGVTIARVAGQDDGCGVGILNQEGRVELANVQVAETRVGFAGDGNSTLSGYTQSGGYWGVLAAGRTTTVRDATISDNTSTGILVIEGGSLSLEGATLSGNGDCGLGVLGDAVVSGAWLTGNYGGGVCTIGGTLELTDSVIDGSVHDEAGAYGLTLESGTVAYVADVALSGDLGGEIFVAGATLDGDRVTLRDPVSHPGAFANGLYAKEGSVVTLRDLEITGVHGAGVLAYGLEPAQAAHDPFVELTRATITDVTFVRADETFGAGAGVLTTEGAYVHAVDLVVEDVAGWGVAAWMGSDVYVENGTITDTRHDEFAATGAALFAADDSQIRCHTCTIDGSEGYAAITDAGGDLLLSNTSISNTSLAPDAPLAVALVATEGGLVTADALTISGTAGPGAWAADGAHLTCGCTISDSTFAGVVVQDATLWLSDSTIEDTRADPNEGGGVSLYVSSADAMSVVRVVGSTLLGAELGGVYVQGPTDYYIADSTIGGAVTTPIYGVPTHGNALLATDSTWDGGGYRTLDTVTFEPGEGYTLFLDSSGLALLNMSTPDTWRQRCGPGTELEGFDPEPECQTSNLPFYVLSPNLNPADIEALEGL